ncbi:MAG: plasmid pRiA4b ORF-3 family protein [Desulfitobacteriaceae bacterium]
MKFRSHREKEMNRGLNMGTIYQIKISLIDIEPLIWRRIIVPSNITFFKLHKIIQAAFDWQDYHLFAFELADCIVDIPDPEFDGMYALPEKNAKRVKIDEYMIEDTSLIYQYDFGDNWEHEIIIEKITEAEEEVHYPVCIDGARHRPPEDVGGIGGYENFLEAINNPNHPEYDDMLVWAEKDTGGRKFDPEYFYLNEVNRTLMKIK